MHTFLSETTVWSALPRHPKEVGSIRRCVPKCHDCRLCKIILLCWASTSILQFRKNVAPTATMWGWFCSLSNHGNRKQAKFQYWSSLDNTQQDDDDDDVPTRKRAPRMDARGTGRHPSFTSESEKMQPVNPVSMTTTIGLVLVESSSRREKSPRSVKSVIAVASTA
eukprot:scaffold8306_cov171-Amphora_coffeaeformis.AAC.12